MSGYRKAGGPVLPAGIDAVLKVLDKPNGAATTTVCKRSLRREALLKQLDALSPLGIAMERTMFAGRLLMLMAEYRSVLLPREVRQVQAVAQAIADDMKEAVA